MQIESLPSAIDSAKASESHRRAAIALEFSAPAEQQAGL
jgi:hypothetical protein